MKTANRAKRCEDEHNKLMKIINYRLPHKFKKIGLISALLIFGLLIASKFLGISDPLVKDLCRSTMLVFLLMTTLSKDRVEDEYVDHIRSQSYTLAFICATAYSILLPLFVFVANILVNKIIDESGTSFYEVSAFEVLFTLICFQILFFETLKRYGRAQ